MAEHDEGTRKGTPRRTLPSLPSLRLPHLPMPLAAAVTGLVCGLVATALVWSGERGCDAVRGRPTCGGYGFFMLIAIIVICYLVGVALLKAFAVREPGVTAFFGMTLPLLVVLGFLLDDVSETWMAIAMPLLVAVGFVLSAYLGRALEAASPGTYAEDGDPEAGPDESADKTNREDADGDLPRYAPTDER
jgi:hypothetical protein